MKQNNVFLYAWALALALLLWFFFGSEFELERKKEVYVPLRLQNLPAKFTASPPDAVTVVAMGPQSRLESLHSDDLKAVADLSGVVETGSYDAPVRVEGPLDLGLKYKAKFPRRKVIIDDRTTALKTVELFTIGDLPKSMLFDPKHALITPSQVKITGPKADVGSAHVRATLGLQKLSTPGSLPAEAIAYGTDGEQLLSVTVEPSQVVVDPRTLSAPTLWTVLVNPSLRGSVAPGYEVVSAQAVPSQVELRSELPGALANVSRVSTTFVNLDGLTATTRVRVAVSTETGVTADPPDVDVLIKIAPVRAKEGNP